MRIKEFTILIVTVISVLFLEATDSQGMNFPGSDSLGLRTGHNTLNNHRFIINSRMGSPFIESYLETSLGAAQTIDLQIPPVIIDSQMVAEIRGDLVYTTLGLEYQQSIRDWMAFRFRISVLGRLATEAGALISQGVNVGAGYEFGWMFKLLQTRNFLLSGMAEIKNTTVTSINLQDFIQGVVDSGRITKSNQLISTTPFTTGGGLLRCAYAFNKTYGFTANLAVSYGESVKRSDGDEWYLEYGGAFDADLKPGTNVPIGFLLGFYHHSIFVSKEVISREPNDILFQINYTGHDDLNLGLEGSYQFYKPEGFDNSIKFLFLNLNMKYFF